jgi:hypothetical protein
MLKAQVALVLRVLHLADSPVPVIPASPHGIVHNGFAIGTDPTSGAGGEQS